MRPAISNSPTEQQAAGLDGQGGAYKGGVQFCLFCYIELSVIYLSLYTPLPSGSADSIDTASEIDTEDLTVSIGDSAIQCLTLSITY